MSEKIYLHLLFFCGFFCQELFAILSDNDTSGHHTELSSNFLVRKRRVINHLPSGRNTTRIEAANYMVKIREGNTARCAGVILSHYTVITAAPCIRYHRSNYTILSGAAYDHRSNHHSVTSNVAYYGSQPIQSIDGISLLSVDPLFDFDARTGSINLYLGPLPVGTHATVSGWGCFYPLRTGTEIRLKLHSITLPIMNHEECRTTYRNNYIHANLNHGYTIRQKHICTYDEDQYCARYDEGAPLVVNNLLAGIFVWKGEFAHERNPDVFINLQLADYREWINEKALLM